MEEQKKRRFDIKEFSKNNSPLIAFLILFIIATLLKGTTFLGISNLLNILLNNSIIGIIALGGMLVIMTAGIDLSVGSMLALVGLVTLTILNQTNSIVLAILGAIAVGCVLGLFTGELVARLGLPAFIVTLGTMRIYRSVAQYWFNGGGTTAMNKNALAFTQIANSSLLGIPLPVIIWAVISVIIYILVKKTALGRHIIAAGSNYRATFLAGINVKRVLIFVYIIAGALVAIASVIEASRLGSMNSASSGLNYEMDAIAATVIGGTSLMGGRGSVAGTIFGTLTLGIINNLMDLLGMPSFLVGAVKGAIIIIAVLMQSLFDRKKD